MNTPQQGKVRTIIFKEDKTWFGVALEFNIVITAATRKEALVELLDTISNYVEVAGDTKGFRADNTPLNQEVDPEYENLWNLLAANKPIPSPYQVGYHGFHTIHAE